MSGASNTSVRASPSGDFLIFLRQSATAPPEIYRSDPAGRGVRAITRMNAPALARLDLTPLEPFSFVGANADSVFGWVMRPPNFDSHKTYPLIYLIHGGPQGAWLDEWHARWNFAMFAARGYVVAGVNFHGSTGYGRRFTNSVSRNWGGLPYDDLMKGLDVLTARSYIDKDHVGAAGGSYGGYMVYWMAGHTTRFRTLVAHDGIFNPLSMAGSTEELWFPIYEFGGSQTSPLARSLMEKWSPANFISQWTTPLLVVHSQNDFRVDVSEGFQAFTAAKLRGLPSKFLYFPDEDHFVSGRGTVGSGGTPCRTGSDASLRPSAGPEPLMRRHLLRFLVNALALCAAVWVVPGLTMRGPRWRFALVVVVFGLVNILLRPLLVILTCPLVVLTLGLFTLVINALLLMATGALSRHWGLGFGVHGFWPALVGGIIVGIVSTVLALAVGDQRRGKDRT